MKGEAVTGAYELLEKYQQDPTKAIPTYEGETLTVQGVVTYIGPDSHHTPSIELSDKAGGMGYVIGVFDSFDMLDKVSLGETVTISGRFHIVARGKVVLKHSEYQ